MFDSTGFPPNELACEPVSKEKRCSGCGETKPHSGFSNCSGKKDGKQNYCRECNNLINRLRRTRPEIKQKIRNYDILRKYGVSHENYQRMWQVQQGCCLICNDPLDAGKHTHVDHDHETDEVRALLCHSCNMALGHTNENPEILRKMMMYAKAAQIRRESSRKGIGHLGRPVDTVI